MHLHLYSKPGCHLCEGLQEKLTAVQAIAPHLALTLEIRDITSNEAWFQAYQYEIPVLHWESPTGLVAVPRLSPRASVAQVQQRLETTLANSETTS